MKAKTKFLRMYNSLSIEARRNLTCDSYTLLGCYNEIFHDTAKGKEILKELGYEDD